MTTRTRVPNDSPEPAEIIAAAEKGEAWAQNWVGVQCLYGNDVPEDRAKGVEWIRKAAMQGDRDAQANLGECYWAGVGVEENQTEAENWCRKAANQGVGGAQLILGFLSDEKHDYKNAVYWYRRSAEQGNGTAQNNLAVLYHAGRGVPVSYVDAYKWYNLAAAQETAQEIKNATEARQEIVKTMTREQIAEGQRLAAEFVPREEHPSQPVESAPKTIAYTLNICGDNIVRNPTAADIRAAVFALDGDKKHCFLILNADDTTYIQTRGTVEVGFDELEYQEGDTLHHYRAKRDFTAEEVVNVLVSYVSGSADWKQAADWEHQDLGQGQDQADSIPPFCNDVTEVIERLEAFEERLGVRVEALNASSFLGAGTNVPWLRVCGELHALDGLAIEHQIQVVVDAYDLSGKLLNTGSQWLSEPGKFYGFETFSIQVNVIGRVAKIRVYPKRV